MSINFAVVSGSSAEGASEKGAASLLAASAFAGTGKRSGLKLVRDLENIGATVGATVDREKITYKLTVLPEKAEEAVAALAEVLTSAPGAAYVVEEAKETAELLRELQQASPKARVLELLAEAAFGENTALGSPVRPPTDSLTAADVAGYRKANFTAANVVVAASGVGIDTLKTWAELYLHGLPASTGSAPALPAASSPYVGGDFKVRDNSVGATHLALGFPVPKGAAAEPYRVLYSALSAKLAAFPVPKNSLSVFLDVGASGGLLGFYATGSAAAAAGHLEAAVAELKAAAAGTGAGAEGAKVKTALEAFLALESGVAGADALLSAATSGTSPVADARKVGGAAVAAAAKAALAAVPSYAVYGVTAGSPSYAAITKLTK